MPKNNSSFRVFATCNIGDDALNLLRERGYELEVYDHLEAPSKSLILEKVCSGIDGLITTLRGRLSPGSTRCNGAPCGSAPRRECSDPNIPAAKACRSLPSTRLTACALAPFHALSNWPSRHRPQLHKDVDVIGHYHPRRQPITLAVEAQQHLLDGSRRARVFEHALAVAEIEIRFEFRALLPVVFDLKQRRPLVPAGRRHRVGQPERHHLQRAGLVVVRQVARVYTLGASVEQRVWHQSTTPSFRRA